MVYDGTGLPFFLFSFLKARQSQSSKTENYAQSFLQDKKKTQKRKSHQLLWSTIKHPVKINIIGDLSHKLSHK